MLFLNAHEMKRTGEIYRYFETQNTTVKVHTHDRHMVVNKLVKASGYTLNPNDSWHGVKSMKKDLKSISTRPRYKEGSIWSEQLLDKEEPVATHVHWALRHCEQNLQKLQNQLSNIVNHYRNVHSDAMQHPGASQVPTMNHLALSSQSKGWKVAIDRNRKFSNIQKSAGLYCCQRHFLCWD